MVDWLEVLKNEVAKSSISDVARQLGYSRPAVSLALSGNYKGSTDKLAAKVVGVFTSHLTCPFLDRAISETECKAFSNRPIPQSNAQALRHWRACQSCPNARTAKEQAHVE